jgi:hypothetical protein
MPKKRMPNEDELKAVSLRLPVALAELLVAESERNRRSINQEAVLWLESYAAQLAGPDHAAPPPARSLPRSHSD